ncbi:hypothetical protein OIE82_02580 [Streptomyces althioticus]|uniref:Uncharacterized protein n=1 Tax=Streptomyces althioticus TaxID=83380 RepID=A0ABZ1YI18_9ACTN|nr:hypothetical protein OG968_02215 [Streptomyces althioticus]WTC00230.1 hypothetical protein OHA53_32740 [Streptomyces althioticus]
MGGVVLGGSLSYVVQHRTQLSAERAERQRQQITLSEARRGERPALLERFIEVSAKTERRVYNRPSEWDGEGLLGGASVRGYLEDNRLAFPDAARA